MVGYEPESWGDLYVAMAGAAAALAGLLFVAVSINLADILKYATLPRRALEALLVMLGVVLVSIFVLVPGQSTAALGAEILVTGAILAAVTLVPRLRSAATTTAGPSLVPRSIVPVSALVLCFGPMIVAGASLLLGSGGGLYWLVPTLVMSFVTAITTAWVLLVEILR